MKIISGVEFNDELGIVTQDDGDSGDSAQRTATLVNLLFLCGEHLESVNIYIKMIESLKVSKGRYKRSSAKGFWGNDPTNFSRDQHSILMLSMAIVGDKKELKDSILWIFKGFGFHQNFLKGTGDIERRWKLPDFISPSELSVAIRGLDLWILYPLLYFLDLGLVADLYLRKKNEWDYDNMLCQNLMYARWKYPTFISKLVFKKYHLTDFRKRLVNYHGPLFNGVAGLSELYVKTWEMTWRFFNEK